MLKQADQPCPNCGGAGLSVFYELSGVPVHSVLLLSSREEAVGFPKGDIALAHCAACDFIGNLAFDPALEQYGAGYEGTQAYSSTFNAFHRTLAERLVEKHDLRGKTVIEIGCGQGEFLNLLSTAGGNTGIGFDPAYDPGRAGAAPAEGTTIIGDFYSEKYADRKGDFVCCKMTLEHIPDTAEFLRMVRRAVGDRPESTVFFMVPDVTRILDEIAFWDIYYEHCSYFSPASRTHLFRHAGFDVIESHSEYDGQYLMIEARPGRNVCAASAGAGSGDAVRRFAKVGSSRIADWRRVLSDMHRAGRTVALWGGGSKAVAFLTTLGLGDEIRWVVDINPHKHGTFLPSSGHCVVGPEALRTQPPHMVVVMNPVYMNEIGVQLGEMGLGPTLVPVTVAPSDIGQDAGPNRDGETPDGA